MRHSAGTGDWSSVHALFLVLWTVCAGREGPVFHLGDCHDLGRLAGPYFAKAALDDGYLDPWLHNQSFTIEIFSAPACEFSDDPENLLTMLFGQGRTAGSFCTAPNASDEEVPPAIAFTGCACSSASMTMGKLAANRYTPYISGGSTTPELADKFQYPTFMRTVPSDSVQADCIARLIYEIGWTRVGWFVIEGESYGLYFARTIPSLLKERGLNHIVISVESQQLRGPEDWPSFNTSTLKENIARYIVPGRVWYRVFVFTSSRQLFSLMYLQELRNIGAVHNHTVPMFLAMCGQSSFEIADLEDWRAVDQTGFWHQPFWDDAVAHLTGSLCSLPAVNARSLLVPGSPASYLLDIMKGMSPERAEALGMPNGAIIPSTAEDWVGDFFMPLYFDAMLTVIFAIGDLLSEGVLAADIRGELLLKAMYKQQFSGVTGNVSFNADGERLSQFVVRNLQLNESLGTNVFKDVFVYTELNDDADGLQEPALPAFRRARFEKVGDLRFGNGKDEITDMLLCTEGQEATVISTPTGGRYEYCRDCRIGKVKATRDYIPLSGLPSLETCQECPPTSYADQAGQTACSYCDEGSFNDLIGASQCTLCPLGTWQNLIAQPHCNRCAPGTYADKKGQLECSPCAQGSYQEGHGHSSCVACPDGMQTLGEFASSSRQCMCPAQTYMIRGESCEPAPTGRTCPFGSLLSDCICERGYRASGDTNATCIPCEAHLHCPGGHRPGWNVPDETVVVQGGYMTMPDEPFSVYECVSKQVCRGRRSPFNSSGSLRMCAEGVDVAPRCGRCEAGRYGSKAGTAAEGCKACGPKKWYLFYGKAAIGLAFSLLTVVYLYCRFNMPAPSGFITLAIIISVIQSLQTFGKLQVAWPDVLESAFNSLEIVGTPDSMLSNIEFHKECWAGHNFWFDVAYTSLQPLVIFVDFAILFMIGKVIGRHLKWDYVHNIIGLVFTRLFITIVRLAFALFYRVSMPNGKVMVFGVPELEFASADWYRILPVSVVATLFYACSTACYVTYLVVTAPVQVANNPNFLARARFCFGPFRPDRHWWILVQLSYGFLLNFAQVATPASNVHVKLYMTVMFLIAFLILAFYTKPFRFAENNAVDLMFNVLLVMLLVLATSFIDPAVLPAVELRTWNRIYAHTILVLFCLCMAWALSHVFRWALKLVIKGAGEAEGKRAQFGWEFRDCTVAILLLSDQSLMKKLSSLGDYDLNRLIDATNTMLTVLLGFQVESMTLRQRLIPGEPHRLWNYRETQLEACDSILHGRLQEKLLQSYRVRAWVVQMAVTARALDSENAVRFLSSVTLHHPGHSAEYEHAHKLLWYLGFQDQETIGREQFQQHVHRQFPHLHIPPEDVDALFDIIDMKAEGAFTLGDFILTISALLPRHALKHDQNPYSTITPSDVGIRIDEGGDSSQSIEEVNSTAGPKTEGLADGSACGTEGVTPRTASA